MMLTNSVPAFFVPGIATESGSEDAYLRLRERAKLDSGAQVRGRRIFGVHGRLGGQDRRLEVGQQLHEDGPDIVAIFETTTGDRYHVYTGLFTPPVRLKSVYEVTDFT